ncbi:maleylacetate reductase [Rhizobium oryzicola]|uniref:Maleylacetate reductase n=1 Tax=Rhizobium oryzicola TaxID=1232668 RepID=A0ABT8SZ43_9HYPH|nr:maleylacetate reductase [Rhizobium oryzicola]MDO1583251.1 maleylacetate reductase [Rhizobium oryzicola]
MGRQSFVYTAHPARVIFGFDTTETLPGEVERLGASKALVLSTPHQEEQAQHLASLLGKSAAGVFAGAVMHTPVHVSEQAVAVASTLGADVVVAIGGGSTTGLGKAIALRTGLPQIVLPTTYAGSEMTPILGETENGLKKTQTTPKVLPQVVIYDVEQTMSLPVSLSGTSGINAMAHAIEALYARDRNPVTSTLALAAVKALASALPKIARDPADRDARYDALYGAWLCGICLGSVGMALHHKLCHTLGGSFELPHAETHTVVLPHALAYNAPTIPDAMAALQTVLGADPARALQELARAVGAPVSLAAIGMSADGLDRATEIAMSNSYWNPRPLEAEAIRTLMQRAFDGAPPLVEGRKTV